MSHSRLDGGAVVHPLQLQQVEVLGDRQGRERPEGVPEPVRTHRQVAPGVPSTSRQNHATTKLASAVATHPKCRNRVRINTTTSGTISTSASEAYDRFTRRFGFSARRTARRAPR